jgi:formate--tetrahydrofolate ligase
VRHAQVVPMDDRTSTSTATSTQSVRRTACSPRCSRRTSCNNKLGLDPLSLNWRRCIDINDRAAASRRAGRQGKRLPRQTGFDITAAPGVMATPRSP